VPTFYDALVNDVSVTDYQDVKGMSANMYFVTHNNPEKQLVRLLEFVTLN